MGALHRKNRIASRRRVDDDGEEEEGSIVAGLEDDSSSEGSAISDGDDDADAEGSEASDLDTPKRTHTTKRNGTDNQNGDANGNTEASSLTSKKLSTSAAIADTHAMLNGMDISGGAEGVEEIHFDDMGRQEDVAPSQEPAKVEQSLPEKTTESLIDRRKREHEEYKKKRDADPAFVPNRGGFFMHDQRNSSAGQNGFRPSIRGRGRGRGAIGGSFAPPVQATPISNPSDALWPHDLHETVAVPEPTRINQPATTTQPSVGLSTKTGVSHLRTPPPIRSFSTSNQVGNVQVRIYISGMKDPIVFSAVPVNQHTRLPHHRPPLRRDKPVRISIPNFPPRYIFPAMDRSFIFIPRALRPNQQGFGRGRGRGSFSAYGGFPSRRTSAYGGSTYTPSVAMSRRSSMARDIPRDGIISPTESIMSRNQNVAIEAGKPVVRLPPASDQGQIYFQQPVYSGATPPVVNLPLPQSYPLPQNPLSRENRPSSLPMHQPTPQKTVSVAHIESPATLNFNPPQQQQQQPFHQQVPLQVNGQGYASDPNLYPHSRHPSHPSQGGTPLSQIPERAIHAQPFQPYPYQQPPNFYPQQYPPPVFFYPPQGPSLPSSVAAPPFVPGQQYPYVVQAPPTPAAPEASTQAGTVAHESNGMVYYYDSSQLVPAAEQPASYPTVTYANQNGYMVAPPALYYPTQ